LKEALGAKKKKIFHPYGKNLFILATELSGDFRQMAYILK
jgi:hypothetical protein